MMNKGKSSGRAVLASDAEIRAAAVDLLARREYSRRELFDRLSRRVDDLNRLDEVMDQLEEVDYLSDRRCATMLARQRLNQGYGVRRIRFDLQQKGIASDLIEQAIDELEADWGEVATDVVLRKYGGRAPRDFKEKAKWMRHLQGRGFGFDEIDQALNRTADEE